LTCSSSWLSHWERMGNTKLSSIPFRGRGNLRLCIYLVALCT
jgi:hypothetical protein